MQFSTEFTPLALDRLRDVAHRMKDNGWRFVQTHAVNCGDTVDLYYSFMKDGKLETYKIEGVTSQDQMPSITDIFLAAFVFENEARELFGVDMRDIAIDFQGGLYAPAVDEPMRFISPEQKAAVDKARARAAKKQAATSESTSADSAAKPFKLSDEKRARLEEKLASMDPAKAKKVRDALAAREANAGKAAEGKTDASSGTENASMRDESASSEVTEVEQSSRKRIDPQVENALRGMEPARAQAVRKQMGGRRGDPREEAEGAPAVMGAEKLDRELESKLSGMPEEKAAKIRAAIASHAVRKGE